MSGSVGYCHQSYDDGFYSHSDGHSKTWNNQCAFYFRLDSLTWSEVVAKNLLWSLTPSMCHGKNMKWIWYDHPSSNGYTNPMAIDGKPNCESHGQIPTLHGLMTIPHVVNHQPTRVNMVNWTLLIWILGQHHEGWVIKCYKYPSVPAKWVCLNFEPQIFMLTIIFPINDHKWR